MKRKYIASLIALFFGWFGAHRFYIGKPLSGILYLIFFWTTIPLTISIIESIYFLTINNERFERMYNFK